MGALTATSPTLMDVQKRLDQKGQVAMVIELLAETNEVLDDMVWIEANQVASHLTTVRTGIPSATWRKLYQGVQPTKSTTKQVTDTIGMLETRALIDCKLADLNGNKAAWRVSEEQAFLEGMNQQMAETVFYGDTEANPERFMGLASRYNAHTGTDKALSTYNVIDGGGLGDDNTSIWFVVWGQTTVHGIYPKGSKAGVEMEDKGKVTITESDGSRWDAYETKYSWDCGLSVRDWRAVVRICNLDVSALVANTSPADLFDLLTDGFHRIRKQKKMGRAAIYCNATVLTALDKQAQSKSNLNLTYKDIAGEMILTYRGTPIRECEQILDTEATISEVS